jgi:N-acetylneuraminate synthase
MAATVEPDSSKDLSMLHDTRPARDHFDNLFIFEMANNHQGSVAHGQRIIDAMADIARRHGIRGAVKFQYRDLDSFIHPDYRERQDVPHIPRFLSTRLDDGDFRKLIDHAREGGLTPIVTPFDEASVKTCLDHGVEIIKVASCSATDWPLLEEIARAGRPVIASTGGVATRDIDKLVSFFNHRNLPFALMHCVSIYPTPNERLQMGFLARMKSRYPAVPVGYSGHEEPDNREVVVAAVAKGADLLERHVGVATQEIKLNAYSMNPQQADAWVAAALRARSICGNGHEKTVTEEEHEALRSLERGVYAQQPIREGADIDGVSVYFAMPRQAGQLSSGEFGRYRAAFRASRDYAAGEPLRESAPDDPVLDLREALHDAKGMLYEARIKIADADQVELSHHYGTERFREVGAVFIHVVNREYCKKLGVMLPGQRHPVHHHQRKEETFQLLWGDLAVDRDGETFELKPGDTLVIERGTRHAFWSRGGGIFEEISTTDIRGDSHYEDPLINRLDPMQRKTFLEGW